MPETNYDIIRADLILGPTMTGFNPFGTPRFANPSGANPGGGSYPGGAFATLQAAINAASAWDTIFVAGGQYDETITIPRTKQGLSIVCLGGRGAAYIEPSTENAGGLINHADDVTLVNIGIAAEDETVGNYALHNTGARLRAYGCKIEGGEQQIRIGPGSDAQITADTRGDAADCLFVDCELAWGTNGVVLVCSDYGAVTQVRFERCRSHNLTGKHITEEVGAGGSASVAFRNLQIIGWDFDNLDDGTEPTNYIDLNGDNANTGIVADCNFPTAINGGLNLVGTGVKWIANRHTGGISTGQPS